MGEKFGQARSRPAGEWVQTTPLLKVAGLAHRVADASAFARAVRAADRGGLPYGLELQPEPGNPHDGNAIKVIGKAKVKRLLASPEWRRWHIGYVPREVAAELKEDLIAAEQAYCAELYGVYVGVDDFLDVEFFVLVPKGSPATLRHARRAAAGASGEEPPLTNEQFELLRHGALGLYRNTRLAQAEALKRLGDVGGALDMYLRVAWLDEYGPSNVGGGDLLRPGVRVFKADEVFTAPGIVKAIAQAANTIGLSLAEVSERFSTCGARETRALGELAPSSDLAEHWPRIEDAIRAQMATGTKWRVPKASTVAG